MTIKTRGLVGKAARKGLGSITYVAAPAWHSFTKHCPRTPPRLELDVTNRCNMVCRHCFATPQEHTGDELSLKEIATLADSINPLLSLALGGGEPFLRGDLAEICALFSRRYPKLSIAVTTNGFSAERVSGTAQAILDTSPEAGLWVTLSLDGFKNTHDEMRQTAGAFDRVMATAQHLSALAQESPRLGFGFNATMTELNWRELPRLAAFVHTEFGVGLGCNLLSGQPRDPSLKLPPLEDVSRALHGMARVEAGAAAAYMKVFNDYRLAALASGRQVAPCVAGSFYGTVAANGDVQSCALLAPLGNLREESFQAIWHGPRATSQRASIRHGACTCHTDCYLRTNMAYYWKVPFSVYRAGIGGLLNRTQRD